MSAPISRRGANRPWLTAASGPIFWAERLSSAVCAMRARRAHASTIASVAAGQTVKLVGTARAIGTPSSAPLSGRRAVFGHVLATQEAARLDHDRAHRVVGPIERGGHTFGGAFELEDASGRARIEVSAELLELGGLELAVPWIRARGRRLGSERLGEVMAILDQALDPETAARCTFAEWAVEDGARVIVLGRVVGYRTALDATDYRAPAREPVISVRERRPMVIALA